MRAVDFANGVVKSIHGTNYRCSRVIFDRGNRGTHPQSLVRIASRWGRSRRGDTFRVTGLQQTCGRTFRSVAQTEVCIDRAGN